MVYTGTIVIVETRACGNFHQKIKTRRANADSKPKSSIQLTEKSSRFQANFVLEFNPSCHNANLEYKGFPKTKEKFSKATNKEVIGNP